MSDAGTSGTGTRAAEVVVVGGGPAGLAAAIGIRRSGHEVVVLEREAEAGGIPRHSDHQGYGVDDLHRMYSGPAYAREYVRRALAAGVRIELETSVTGWSTDGRLLLTSPRGRESMEPRAVVLATGCRERPRSARLIPGTRPQGVMTTGTLQQLVHLGHGSVGTRAVVVGAEHVGFSALLTLAAAGAEPIALVTELPDHQTYGPIALATARRMRVPVLRRTRLVRIDGSPRVEAVALEDLASGEVSRLQVDTVILSGDWIPDHELARLGGLGMDPGSRGPLIDAHFRTTRPGVFAVGNLLRGAEPANVVTREGVRVAAVVEAWLADRTWPSVARVRLRAEEPVAWTTPNLLLPREPLAGSLRVRAGDFAGRSIATVRQGKRTLWEGRPVAGAAAAFLPFLPEGLRHGAVAPGRSFTIPLGWASTVEPDEEVRLHLAGG